MFEKILVAIDGSDHSIRGLSEALKLSKLAKSSITLIHICPYKLSELASPKQELLHKLSREEGENYLVSGKKIAEKEGITVEALLLEGDEVDMIVKKAREDGFNLIVVGARGLSKIKSLLIGSISEGIIRKAPCPVLVVR